jgi:PKD repeat protein
MNQRLSISLLLGVILAVSLLVAFALAGGSSGVALAEDDVSLDITMGDIAIEMPGPAAATDQVISFSAVFTDPPPVNTHTAAWVWGDGSSDTCPPDSEACTLDQESDSVTGSHVYREPGIYTINLTITDDNNDRGSNTVEIEVVENQPPDCSNASPSIDTIWPPTHKFVAVNVLGVTDPDGDPVSITIDSIYQDEPVDTFGDGNFAPDGQAIGTGTAEVRAERVGGGNGRVYHIGFSATAGQHACTGEEVTVGVPHDEKDVPVDDGALYDSTASTP